MLRPKHSCVSSVKKIFKRKTFQAPISTRQVVCCHDDYFFCYRFATSDSGDCGEISVGPRYELRKTIRAAEPSRSQRLKSFHHNNNNNTCSVWQGSNNRRMRQTSRAISPFQIPISLCSPGDTVIQGAKHTDTEGSAAGKPPPQGRRTGNRGLDSCQTHAFSNAQLSHRSLSNQTHSARTTLALWRQHQLPWSAYKKLDLTHIDSVAPNTADSLQFAKDAERPQVLRMGGFTIHSLP